MPHPGRAFADGPACFNPRPPLLAGDACASPAWGCGAQVSIRARHCWRAMPGTAGTMISPWCFNPRPPLLAGDAIRHLHPAHQGCVSIRARHCWRAMPANCVRFALFSAFQSAPAIAGGRCGRRSSRRPARRCFNPRPPLLAGDACATTVRHRGRVVSIRARHCWRAMPGRC